MKKKLNLIIERCDLCPYVKGIECFEDVQCGLTGKWLKLAEDKYPEEMEGIIEIPDWCKLEDND